MSACEKWKEELVALLDGDLGPLARWRARRHLRRCAGCAAWAGQAERDLVTFRAAMLAPAEPEFVEAVWQRIELLPAPAPPAAPATFPRRGWLAVAAAGTAAAAWLAAAPFLASVRDHHGTAACQHSLRQLAQAANAYAQDFDGSLPPAGQWSAALAAFGSGTGLPSCPLVGTESPAAGYSFNAALGAARLAEVTQRSSVPLVYDGRGAAFEPRHGGLGNVVFLEGAVRALGEPPESLFALPGR